MNQDIAQHLASIVAAKIPKHADMARTEEGTCARTSIGICGQIQRDTTSARKLSLYVLTILATTLQEGAWNVPQILIVAGVTLSGVAVYAVRRRRVES